MGRERIHGPYKHRQQYRVIQVRADGTREVVSFASEAEAHHYIAAAKKVAIGRSVGDAVREYLEHMALEPGRGGSVLRQSTLDLMRLRLVAFLHLPQEDRPLGALTRGVARKLFDMRTAEVKPDTLIGELATARRWARFWVEDGALTQDPFDGLVVRGERSAGKPQLRVDEARRFLGSVLAEQTPAATAVALALLTGMRASEITGLVVHDLDDGGRLLWVADNLVRRLKTRKSRQLAVPSLLVPRMRALAEGKGRDDRLWGDVDRHWLLRNVVRLCKVAGVPIVTPHGLRGTWATLARAVMPTDAVAATLGNLPKVSATSYIAPGAAASADGRRVEGMLNRGGYDAEVQVDDRDRGERDVGGGRLRHDGREGAADAGRAPAVREHDARAEGPGAVGPGPGQHRADPGVEVGRPADGGDAGPASAAWLN